MRIARLDLLAYGPFTQKTLDFSLKPGALQLVYGPNEAGKSSTLRALIGLLYGIDTRTSDAHLHRMDQLRIGATLVDELGHELSVIRRKGTKNTLLDAAEQPVGEGALTPLLGGLDEKLFRQMFGLDHERLREGAEALLRGGGQLGEVLFDASTGGRGVHTLIERLRAEADALFKQRGRTPELNAALDSLRDKKKKLKDAAMKPEAYEAQQLALTEARAARDTAVERRRTLGAEKSRLTRSLQLVPLLAKRDLLWAELQQHEAVVAREELRGEVLQELNRRFGGVQASAREEPGWQAQQESLAREIEALRARLGDGLSGLQELDTATRVRVRKLVECERTLSAERAELVRIEAGAAEERERLTRRLAEQPAVTSSALATLLSELEREDLLGQLARHGSELDKLRAQLARRHQQLGLTVELEALAQASLPSEAALGELERAFEHSERERERLTRERSQSAEQLTLVAAQRAELLVRGELVTREQLALARSERNAAFDALFTISPGAVQGIASPPLPAAVRAYAAATEHADKLADRMVSEAHEAAALSRLDLSVAQLETRLCALDAALSQVAARAAQQAARWLSLAEPLGLSRHTPRTARTALAELTMLREQLRERAELEARAGQLERRADECALALHTQLAVDASQPLAVSARQRLEQGLRAARERLSLEHDRARERGLLCAQLDKLVTEHALRSGRLRVVDDELAASRQRYLAELTQLGLGQSLQPDELLACFDELGALATRTRELATLIARIEAARRERESLTLDVQREVVRLRIAAEGQSLPLEQALGALAEVQRERSQAQRDQQRQRSELHKLDTQLLEFGDGQPLAELRTSLLTFEPHLARARLEELERELDEHAGTLSDLEQSIGRLAGGVESLQSDSGAAGLAEDYEQELSRARSLSRRYVEVRLALSLLSNEVERYRTQNQQPVLKRASELFPRLTLDRYRGLTVDYDEQDEPVLSCLLRTGQSLRIGALSDGTRDQLYLALRVASIERYFEGRPPLPLILDDALIHFDDVRAAAALEVLGELTKHTQVLFFTHHARMLELARSALGDDKLQVHELASRLEPRSDGPLFESSN